MRSSVVTTAIQPLPIVTAAGFAPAGRLMFAGNDGAGAFGLGIRVTITETTAMTPTIMVTVSSMTSHFNSRKLAGNWMSSKGSDMALLSSDDIECLIVTIGPDAPQRLDKALAAAVPEDAALSRSRLMRMIAEGAVSRVSGDGQVVVTDPKTKVQAGQEFAVQLEPAAEVETLAEDIPLVVVWEDNDLIVINKAAGMVVHPAPGTPSGTLVNALLAHCGDTLSGIGGERRPGIVHRIDKDTTGLLVVAKSDRAHHGLAAQFVAHSVLRRYLAVVNEVPSAYDPRIRGLRGVTFEAGGILKIATGLTRHKTDRQRQAVVWDQGRHAVTRARVVEDFRGGASLVECWLETGRTHQIRVHMAYVGHGLVGDQTYGAKKRLSPKLFGPAADLGNGFPRQALHAASLGFQHPVSGEMLEFQAALPDDMSALIAALRA